MKLFHETKIELYSEKEEKICIVSDIHFSDRVKTKKLDSLARKIAERKPNYIFVPGDLVDYNDLIFDEKEEVRLLDFFEKLGKITTTIISVGNHDEYKLASKEHEKKTKEKYLHYKNESFIKKLKNFENVFYLDNEKFEDENIFVVGITQKSDYYNFYGHEKKTTVITPTNESVDVFLKELDTLDKSFLNNLPKTKKKFALIHSPVVLTDEKVQEKLKEFDYFISGHMHNGVVPPLFDTIWRSSRGVISPTRNLLAKNTRQSKKVLKKKLIISGAVTTWHKDIHKLNFAYPSYFMTLEFKNDKDLKEEPKITKKYLKY